MLTLGIQAFFDGIIIFGVAWVVKCATQACCSHFVEGVYFMVLMSLLWMTLRFTEFGYELMHVTGSRVLC